MPDIFTGGETMSDVRANRDGRPTATALICASCGAHFSSTGNFCSVCGARLTQATRSPEYKQVTVLFADVVRSMDIAATLDLERLREIMTEVCPRFSWWPLCWRCSCGPRVSGSRIPL